MELTTLSIFFSIYLIELQSATANGIFQALFNFLQVYGMKKISSHLVSVERDSATVMLVRTSGVAKH
jgi:hypothetical protein